ncbi:MAG: hypothetical protein EU533_00560 [Promethearchaeota archaeon]|nr:MAG: hypothetical protein EU533_00560 [Candidatus Lokiarchaeota archaeon]
MPEELDNQGSNEELSKEKKDDLEEYLEEMKALETDFSDLDDLDFEELKAMQEAIKKVQEGEIPETKEKVKPLQSQSAETTFTDHEKYVTEKEKLFTDFSDLDEMDFDELEEMKAAVESVKQEEISSDQDVVSAETPQMISTELEERIKQELEERKEEEEEKVVSPEEFIEYASNRRDKIWYHSLYYLVFQAEDHVASKQLLYDMMKEITSKSPIDPIPEHQFYFGLGYILRLTLNKKQVIRYLTGGKFKINIEVKILKEILEKVGEPISTRPVIKEEEKKKMYKDFLTDDFLDI